MTEVPNEEPNQQHQNKLDLIIPDGVKEIIDLQNSLQNLDDLTLDSTILKIKNIFKDSKFFQPLAQTIDAYAFNRFKQLDIISQLAYRLAVEIPGFSPYILQASHGLLLRRLFERSLFSIEQIQAKCERDEYDYVYFVQELSIPKYILHAASLNNFEKLFKQFSMNDFQKYKEWLQYGFDRDTIQTYIELNDQNAFQNYINNSDFDIQQMYTDTPFCPFTGYKENFFPERPKFSLLAISAFFGNYSCFKQLLKINQTITDTVCKCAVRGGNIEILELCKQHGGTFEGCLDIAVHCYQNHVFDWLISNVEAYTDKLPSLEVIAKSGNLLTAILFLTSGGNIKDGEDLPRPPIHRAAERGHDLMLRLLIENGADPTVKNKFGDLIIHTAAQLGRTDTVKYLIDRGCSVTESNPKGWTPLHNAARNDNTEIIKMLVERGADVNALTSTGHSVFHIAVLNNNFNVAKLLLDLHADPNTKSKDGKERSPLTVAISKSQEELALRMIDLGADVNIKTLDGRVTTPLAVAVSKGLTKLAMKIVEKGGEVNTRADLVSPLALATQQGNQELIQFLKDHGAYDVPTTNPDHSIVVPPSEQIVLKQPYDVKAKDFFGRTLLLKACETGQLDVVKQLVKEFSNINEKDCNGSTPLMTAIQCKHEDVAIYLMSRGADVNLKNKQDKTALHFAAELDMLKIVTELKKRDAYMNPASSLIGTPLSIAKSPEMKKLIARYGGV